MQESIRPRLKRSLPRRIPAAFGRSESGGLTATMVLSTTLVIVALGAMVDFGRFVSARTALQAAIDGAALQGATSALTGDELSTLVQQSVAQNFRSDNYGTIVVSSSTTAGNTLIVAGQLTFETNFIRIAGTQSFEISMQAEASMAQSSSKDIEAALVLDVSYTNTTVYTQYVKDAATAFTDGLLSEEDTTAKRRAAIIPYNNVVYLDSRASEARGSSTSGTCSIPGCAKYYYPYYNAYWYKKSGYTTVGLSDCVTERTGDNAYTESPVANGYVGYHYGSYCFGYYNPIVPLTDDTSTLSSGINKIYAMGSRAGQIGIAWGWYALSPVFGFFTGDSSPASYGDENTRKTLVIVSTGSYYTAYCNGVMALDSTQTFVKSDFSTRVAVIPYSYGVNLGSRAADVRGSIAAGSWNLYQSRLRQLHVHKLLQGGKNFRGHGLRNGAHRN